MQTPSPTPPSTSAPTPKPALNTARNKQVGHPLSEQALLDALAISAEQKQQLEQYLAAILKWNAVYNLTAIKNPQQAWQLHILDSLAALLAVDVLLPHIDKDSADALRVLDVGSGGGLPGVVWAVVRPHWQVCCVDAVAKKIGFIKQAAGQLGARNVSALHTRIENHTEHYDVVTSRAFAALDKFVGLTDKNVAAGGGWFALKSKLLDDELLVLDDGQYMFHVEQCAVPDVDVERSVVLIQER